MVWLSKLSAIFICLDTWRKQNLRPPSYYGRWQKYCTLPADIKIGKAICLDLLICIWDKYFLASSYSAWKSMRAIKAEKTTQYTYQSFWNNCKVICGSSNLLDHFLPVCFGPKHVSCKPRPTFVFPGFGCAPGRVTKTFFRLTLSLLKVSSDGKKRLP